MIDHVLGRPSVKSRRLQVLAVLGVWSAYLLKGHKHGPPVARFFSRLLSKKLTAWQTVVLTMIYLYAARNFSTLVGLASPEPLANMYDTTYFRATWVLTALDAGFWTAMGIRNKRLRDLASMVFSVFYLVAAEKADEKVRKVRGNITVEHLRVSWNKGSQSPYLRFFQGLVRPRFTRWPPRAIRIPRPATSDYKEPVSGWLYYDGPLSDLERHNRIVLDIPGGGFVAMDPRCNDDKLFAWAAKTGLPVLSLDYKKAPEYPYPYALNECYDVYCTIVKSKGRCIGLSGKEVPRIVITGDSAGGNFATSMTLMIIESGSRSESRFQGQGDIPIPDGLILFYPGLDMNIGSWMSDEQMALIKDRRMRGTNKRIIERKSMQYNDLVGTPHQSDDEGEGDDNTNTTTSSATLKKAVDDEGSGAVPADQSSLADGHVKNPAPEYAHSGPSTWSQTQGPPSPAAVTKSHHPEPMRTRLAMSSMISYFNDRILTPEMMRAMIILYVGPHNRPDFAQDYLLSPILAPDALLAKFPKTYFLTGERDPLVDDTVVFSGRLRRVKAAQMASGGTRFEYRDQDAQTPGFNEKDVAEVALIPGISHGFVQFPTIYPPAWKLIDRSAHWIEDVFNDAERKEHQQREQQRRKMHQQQQQQEQMVNGGAGRHHFRQESTSGDEDRPLEMSMTKVKARGRQPKEGVAEGGVNGNGVKGGREGEGTVQSPEGYSDDSPGKKNRGGKGRKFRTKSGNKSWIKLNSSDDLLGRRMQGLAGGLTGLAADVE
ncbi:hormone-sensitive lipase [Diplogelasinospora grovesii]|uniref:Hormone-sensitive lipase n=1 Tax=Diplogelasinospora grovesii TaxID=303347 RepID=A0AAN6S9X2_9PEZI|nr:hormone-sensitive lipase [Diplogelasinospora grovesii]